MPRIRSQPRAPARRTPRSCEGRRDSDALSNPPPTARAGPMAGACQPRHEPPRGAHRGDCSAKYGLDAPSIHHSIDRSSAQPALKPVDLRADEFDIGRARASCDRIACIPRPLRCALGQVDRALKSSTKPRRRSGLSWGIGSARRRFARDPTLTCRGVASRQSTCSRGAEAVGRTVVRDARSTEAPSRSRSRQCMPARHTHRSDPAT
ncbi:hypothetical protein J2Y46_003896 [Microbacterium sp. BE35]|nr:hypothetical protein [Microbacterium sp. BE35]